MTKGYHSAEENQMKQNHHWRDLNVKLFVIILVFSMTLFGCGSGDENDNLSIESRPLSLTDNGDGTISDNNTSLMWQKTDSDQIYNWYEANGEIDDTYNPESAIDICGELELGGYTDWRLPEVEELISIVKYNTKNPAIDTSAFSNTHSSKYWTSTATFVQWDTNYGRVVDFSMGTFRIDRSQYPYFVKCVRGDLLEKGELLDNNDGTVSDDLTGLMWQQDTGPLSNFDDASSYCNQLDLGGFDDWEVPSVWELSTIVDFSTISPAVDVSVFPETYTTNEYYQTRNHTIDGAHTNWSIDFTYGGSYAGGTSQLHWVRCVR